MLRISCASAALILTLIGSAVGQSQFPQGQRRIVVGRPHAREIPEATLASTPEEANWWGELRKAAKAVQESRGRREREKFLDLLQQGREKSFQPPIPDSRAIILSKVEPSYSEQARRKRISGTVKMAVNIRADGYVGEVEILEGPGHGLNERAAEAARLTTFIPPVKDRKFTPYRLLMEMNFNIY